MGARTARKGRQAKVVSVSLPPSLLLELDRFVGDAEFHGRSDAVQAALVQFLAEHREQAHRHEHQNAIIAVCFNKRDERRVGEVKHDYGDVLKSMLHTHLAGTDCVEVFVVEGAGPRIASMARALSGLKGVHLVRRTYIPRHEGLGV
jgi:metal-responsive CopG/Arc/MetJ family transcriptional regulator